MLFHLILHSIVERIRNIAADKWHKETRLFYGSWLIGGAITLIILIYTAIHEEINWWIDIHCSFIIDFFTMLCSHWQTNLFLTATSVCLCVKVNISFYKDKLISSNKILLSIGLLIWLCITDGRIYYDTIIPHFSYRLLLLLSAAVTCFLELNKINVSSYESGKKKAEKKPDEILGFTSDNVDIESTDSEHRKKLVKLVTSRLLNTYLERESFAAGIVGSWGSGKTTFLHLMQEELMDKAYIMTFLPWNCSSPSQIVADFLSQLKESLSPHLGFLGHTISEYAEQLSELDDSIGSKISNKILHQVNDSISVTKEKLSQEIAKLDKPVVVFIDDLDRLEVSEIFEVLKIIRNTASFKNTIYIVAYDKSYIIKTMTEHKFTGAERYLEKIFQVEIPLPMPEPNEIYRVFIRDINEMSLVKDHELLGLKLFTYPDLKQLASALPNFREIRRLARLYAVELYFFKEQNVKTFDFDPKDLLWLTSIMMLDYDTYQELYASPEKFLISTRTPKNNVEIYQLRPGISLSKKKLTDEEKENQYSGFLSRSTRIALEQMFVKPSYTSGSIMVKNSFKKYFYLGIGRFNITIQQFIEILDKDLTEIPTEIKRITNRYNADNLFTHFELYKVSDNNIQALRKYYTALVCWAFYSTSPLAINACRHRFVNEAFITTLDKKKEYLAIVMDIFKSSIDAINKISTVYFVAQLIKAMYPTATDEDYDYVDYEGDNTLYSLLWQNELKALMKKLIVHYFTIFTDDDAADILDRNTRLGVLYAYTSVCTYSDYNDYSNDKYDNLVIDEIIAHFSRHKSNKLSYIKRVVDNNYYGDPIEYDQWIQQHFSNGDKYKEYISKCFVEEDKGSNDNADTE